jgi:hypothetical protein
MAANSVQRGDPGRALCSLRCSESASCDESTPTTQMRFWVSSFGGVAVVLMLAGIRLIGVLTATIASYFIGGKEDKSGRRSSPDWNGSRRYFTARRAPS